MLEKTAGIVLSTIPYNDHFQFVHIYTERFGKTTYRIPTGRGRRHASTRRQWAPLSLLELDVCHTPTQEIQTIREAQMRLSPYELTAGNPFKAAQCLYIAELIDKTIREVEPNARLWQFLRQGIELLSLPQGGEANFHLIFTTRLCYLLGFRVDIESYGEGMMFDISEGVFTRGPIYHPYYLHAESATWLYRLLLTDFSHSASLLLNREQRDTLLDMMLTFLYIHIPEVGAIRSVEVLKELFT